jgi:hypothetical protein
VISGFVEKAISQVVLEEDMRQEILPIVTSRLEEMKEAAFDELQKILADEKHQPITYNHYYTDNIQRARQESVRVSIQKAVEGAVAEEFNGKFHISNTHTDSEKLLAALQKRVIVNMDAQACAEALGGLHAYYKVSKPLLSPPSIASVC